MREGDWIDRIDGTLQDILDDDRAAAGLSEGSAFLSGGVDSALLLAASGVKRAASIRFRESAHSEWEAASETAAYLGRALRGITLSPAEYLDAISRYVKNAELPTSDSCVTAFLLDCEHTGGKDGPWLSGEGADEFFAGYNNYRMAPELAWDGGPTHYGLYGIMTREDARRLLRQEKACPAEALVRDLYAQTARDEHLSRLLLIDIRLWLEGDILLSLNRSARANGVELLLPYADKRMFELSAAIPSDLKWRDGCGKSTVLSLISRLYEPNGGTITLDGADISTLNQDTIRNSIGMVTQTPYLFSMSLRDNFRLVKSDVTDEEIVEVCKTACVHDDIMRLPDGYDTVIGEGGSMLSGGQRQRIALARALLRDYPVIMLDEATSALDNETQATIRDAIENMHGKRTVVMIAHWLSTVVNCERLFYLENGKVLASGTHAELLERCPEYRRLYSEEAGA